MTIVLTHGAHDSAQARTTAYRTGGSGADVVLRRDPAGQEPPASAVTALGARLAR